MIVFRKHLIESHHIWEPIDQHPWEHDPEHRDEEYEMWVAREEKNTDKDEGETRE